MRDPFAAVDGTRGGVDRLGAGGEAAGGSGEGGERVAHAGEVGVVEQVEELAHLAGVELPEAVDEVGAGRGEPDDDLAAVGGVVAAGGEALVDDPVDEAADGGQRDAEAGDELRHVEVAGGAEEVEQLGLRHRDGDLQELGRVAARPCAA